MARSLRRAREVGIRKLSGAGSISIFGQFTIEAVIISLFSLLLGVGLFSMLRDHFIQLLPRAEEMVLLELDYQLIGWFILFAVITGVISGLAPSLYFVRMSSLSALRSGKLIKALSGIGLRKGLIVAQFALSSIFVLAVVIVDKQYRFSMNFDMGFDRENVLNVSLQENDPNVLRSEFLKMPEVTKVSFSSYNLGIGTWNSLKLVDPRNQDSVWVHDIFVSETYLENMVLTLLAGRNFRPDENQIQEAAILVNEQFVVEFGLQDPSNALGTTFNVGGQRVEIIGVLKNFIYANLEEEIHPMVLRSGTNYRFANLKIASSDMIGVMDKLERSWESVDSRNRFEATFLDDQVQEYYQFFLDIKKLFGFVGFLAISISCLGMFGMALYSTQTRLKEIGIRKTFGASEKVLVYLLSKGFIKMVAWAVIIGTPISYFVFDQFILAQQVYRTYISFFDVSISILFLLVICLLTIITQTWRAARTNPCEVLRNE